MGEIFKWETGQIVAVREREKIQRRSISEVSKAGVATVPGAGSRYSPTRFNKEGCEIGSLVDSYYGPMRIYPWDHESARLWRIKAATVALFQPAFSLLDFPEDEVREALGHAIGNAKSERERQARRSAA